MLVDRLSEVGQIGGILETARSGRSAAMIVRGEPGIGKTALCERTRELAVDFLVLFARGVESESDLPYGGLLQAVRPIVHLIDGLPDRQAAALASALALAPPAEGDRFAVAAATLSLLAAAAEARPILVLIDDAHWLDAASGEALRFAARRLEADAVAFLFSAREEPSFLDGSGLAELRVVGLDRGSSAELLLEHAPSAVPAVADQLIDAAAGNPLALIETPALLTDEQLRGTEPIVDPLPVGDRLAQTFTLRLAEIDDAPRAAMLVAAAGAAEDTAVVLATIGGAEALGPAENAGLVRLSAGSLEFRHPLLRSAVYHGASPEDRRLVHAALAQHLTETPERRAWHLAAATVGTDEAVAAELERAGDSAMQRGAIASAAAAYRRAAALSPRGDDHARRLLATGQALHLIGAAAEGREVAEQAHAATTSPELRAQIAHLRGQLALVTEPPARSFEILNAGAEEIAPFAPERAAMMLNNAGGACIMSGRVRDGVAVLRRAVEVATDPDGVTRLISEMMLGEALALLGEGLEGRPRLLRAVERSEARLNELPPMAVAELAPQFQGVTWIEEFDRARALFDRVSAIFREWGALAPIALCQAALADIEFRCGRWQLAHSLLVEGRRVAEDTGQVMHVGYCDTSLARLAAYRGLDAECRPAATDAVEIFSMFGVESLVAYAYDALGHLDFALGNYPAAIAHLRQVESLTQKHGVRDAGHIHWQPDLFEALLRVGDDTAAMAVLRQLEEDAERSLTQWGAAASAHCRGMVADVASFEHEFAAAKAGFDAMPAPFDRARTELAWGERLRRDRRRAESRPLLRGALETFERLEAQPWADRARAELEATGERVRSRATSEEQLTPQELQVALAVAEGGTNKQVAAALFLSPKTVEFHLGNVYRKLGLRSRAALARKLAVEGLGQSA